jgi:hypothetical protein
MAAAAAARQRVLVMHTGVQMDHAEQMWEANNPHRRGHPRVSGRCRWLQLRPVHLILGVDTPRYNHAPKKPYLRPASLPCFLPSIGFTPDYLLFQVLKWLQARPVHLLLGVDIQVHDAPPKKPYLRRASLPYFLPSIGFTPECLLF